MHYFGPWADPDGALKKYLEQKDDLHAGRKPRPDPEALTVKDVANAFLNAKQALVDSGELSPRTWGDYKACDGHAWPRLGKSRLASPTWARTTSPPCGTELAEVGAAPPEQRHSAHPLRVQVRFRSRPDRPPRPVRARVQAAGKKTLRLHRAGQGPKLFTADEIRRLLDAAGVPLRGDDPARHQLRLRQRRLRQPARCPPSTWTRA